MVALDRFSDGNPEGWIFRAELYFTYLGFSEKDWLPLPYHYLDGEALAWFDWLFRNEQFFDWNHFKEKLKLRFRNRTRDALAGCLAVDQQHKPLEDFVAQSAAIPSWCNTSTSPSPQRWNKLSNNNNLNVSYELFEEMPDASQDDEAVAETSEVPEKYIDANSMYNESIQGLMMAMMDNNTRMLNLLDKIDNKLSASSKTIPEAPEHIDMAGCLGDKIESEEFSGAEIDSYLDKGRYSSVDNFEFLIEMVEIDSDDGKNSKGYDCKVFGEMPNKKTDVKVEDSLKTYSVKPETQVFDERFQITSPVKCYFRDLVMFDNLLALPCMLSVCGHNLLISRGTFDYVSDLGLVILVLSLHQCPPNQFELYFPFDPGSSLFITFLGTTRKDICCGTVSNLTHANFMTLTMCNFFIAPLGLQFKSTNRVRKYVLLALSQVSLVWHMWIGRSNVPLEEIDLEHVYTFELETARRWKFLKIVLVEGEDHGLGMIFYRPMVSAAANKELFTLMSNIIAHFRKLDTAAKTMHMIEATNKSKCTITMSLRSLGRRVVEKIIADNSEAHSPFDLDYIGNDIFRLRSSCGFYIPRTITGRVKMPFSGEKVFLKCYGSGGLQNGIIIFLSCAISDMFSISCASLILNKIPGQVPLQWNIVAAFTPYVCTEKAELLKIISMAAVISQSLVYQVFLMLKFLGFYLDVPPHMSLSTAPWAFLLLVAWYNDGLGFHFNLSTARLQSSLDNRVLNGWQSFKRNAASQNTSASSSKNSSNLLSSSMLHYLNLEDKVLIEDGSIVMNHPQSNIGLRRVIGLRRSQRVRRPSKRLIWDPGP